MTMVFDEGFTLNYVAQKNNQHCRVVKASLSEMVDSALVPAESNQANRKKLVSIVTRGGVLEDVLGLEDRF